MEQLKKLMSASQKFETTRQHSAAFLSKLQQTEQLPPDIEQEANTALSELKEILVVAEELRLLAAVCFSDRPAFQITDDQLLQLDGFCVQTIPKAKQLESQIVNVITARKREIAQKRQSERSRQFAQNTLNSVKTEQEQNMKEWTANVGTGVKELKNVMKDINDSVEKGQVSADVLGDKVKENVVENKLAVTKVQQARAALKKNHDVIYMVIGVACCAGLVISFFFK